MSVRSIALGALLLATSPVSAFASSTPSSVHHTPAKTHAAAPAPKVAPADEYFGRMKMSILGITNSIRDTGTREGFDPSHASQYYGGLAMTENALLDWAHKYPQDSWIPRRAYDMSHDFWRMHTADGDRQAQVCRNVLFHQFPHNHWAVIAKRENAAMIAPVTTAAAQPGQPAAQQQQQH
jgi:hypothetical protein